MGDESGRQAGKLPPGARQTSVQSDTACPPCLPGLTLHSKPAHLFEGVCAPGVGGLDPQAALQRLQHRALAAAVGAAHKGDVLQHGAGGWQHTVGSRQVRGGGQRSAAVRSSRGRGRGTPNLHSFSLPASAAIQLQAGASSHPHTACARLAQAGCDRGSGACYRLLSVCRSPRQSPWQSFRGT